MDDDFGDLSNQKAPAPPPPKAKRSLFSKKITAKVPAESEPVDFYSRARDLYPQRRAEEERRRQKKLEKIERKRSSTSVEVKEGSPSGEKRRKLLGQTNGHSSDGIVQNHDDGSGEGHRDSTHSLDGKARNQNRGSPSSLSARYTKELGAHKSESPKQKAAGKGHISLSDSEEQGASEDEVEKPPTKLPVRYPTRQAITTLSDDDDEFTIAPRRVRLPPVELEAEKSDEEFPELVAAAKERARKLAEQKLAAAAAISTQNQDDVDGDDVFSTEAPTTKAEPVIDILITSLIKGTKPLAVKRKLYGKLREVRWAWCDKQLIDGEKFTQQCKDSIFLTWKGNKLWDWSDCSGCMDRGGKLSMDSYDDGKVHLEAWTQEVFDEWKKNGEARQRRDEHSEEEEVKAAPVPRTKLFMKSRQFPDYRLIVKGSTTIQKMIAAFRTEHDIAEEQEITLHFDGDKLDPDDKIEDTELEDMDAVEVQIQ
ncbi:uncharacterized protein RSE6_02718 [Rhynchosporium secalis]|uniref:Rad60/SUMO-like domain-containing protein n=1 Tax=Rhynchosporium secalis TaxID=38038 RepID=A0A1E1M0Y0_RHYSE|nr:uncharacterized protein RSE6_02718 [Rhynchosporium secalis]